MQYATFSLLIDDIVRPDGRTHMGLLGGGGPQTALGMKLWANEVAVSGVVGADFPTGAQEWLDKMEIDASAVRRIDGAGLRAWQLYEADGRRTQTWRVEPGPIFKQVGQARDALADDFPHARGVHLGIHPEQPPLALFHRLRANGTVVSVEPFRPAPNPPNPVDLRALLAATDIFSPNRREAESLVGPGEPQALIARLAEAGARVVTLRLGGDGSLVHDAATGETQHIPAVDTDVVDVTGAGNGYGGGFLVGWVQTHDLRVAGRYGSVAASFLVEQVGLPLAPLADLRDEAQRRWAALS